MSISTRRGGRLGAPTILDSFRWLPHPDRRRAVAATGARRRRRAVRRPVRPPRCRPRLRFRSPDREVLRGAPRTHGRLVSGTRRVAMAKVTTPEEAKSAPKESPARATPRAAEELRKIDAYWRAANYLSVGQIYLYDNPLLKKPLTKEHVKPRLLGHWGTTPGLNFIYVHLNRVIKKYDLNMLYITGPGHGGPGLVANAYLEGTYSEVYPNVSEDENGMKRLFRSEERRVGKE